MCPKIEKIEEKINNISNDTLKIQPIIFHHGNTTVSRDSICNGDQLNKENVRNVIFEFFIKQKISCFLKFGTIRRNSVTNLNKKEITAYALFILCVYKNDHEKKYLFSFETINSNDCMLTAM